MCLVRQTVSCCILWLASCAASSLWAGDGLLSVVAHAPSADSTRATASPSVVVLDVALVFKNHARFKQRMAEIRQEIDRYDKEISAEQQAIAARGSRIKEFKSGSPDYKKIQDGAARELAELRIRAMSRKNEILDREGKIYYETYQEIVGAVAQLTKRHNISLVVRYNSDETDPLDRGSIFKAINRDVVFQRQLDISKLVIEQVNSPSVAAKVNPGGKR